MWSFKSLCRDSGSVLIEMGMAIPIVLVLAFGAVEIVNYIRAQQTIALLNREAVNLAFRSCAELIDSGSNLNDCLNTQRTSIANVARLTLPDFSADNVRFTMYRMEVNAATAHTPSPVYEMHGPFLSCSQSTSEGCIGSRFQQSDFLAGQNYFALLQESGVFVASEVNYRYRSVMTGASALGIPRFSEVSDVTIF